MNEPVTVGGAPAPATTDRRRLLILAGVAVALVVVALVVPKLLFGGGDEAFDDLSTVPATAAPAATSDVTTAVDPIEAEPVRTYEVFSTKNPFTPLIDLNPVVAAPAVAVDPALVADGDTAPAPSTGIGSAPVAQSSPAPVGGVASEPGTGQRVALLEVFVNEDAVTVASVRVNGTVYEVAAGETFATRYQAVNLSLADGCGQFLYGDKAFRMCEGEELLK